MPSQAREHLITGTPHKKKNKTNKPTNDVGPRFVSCCCIIFLIIWTESFSDICLCHLPLNDTHHVTCQIHSPSKTFEFYIPRSLAGRAGGFEIKNSYPSKSCDPPISLPTTVTLGGEQTGSCHNNRNRIRKQTSMSAQTMDLTGDLRFMTPAN